MTPHILVIDDQISLPRFIAMELHSEGYQVSLSGDRVGASAKLQELNPDLIVLNWELRCTSGLNMCRQLMSVENQVPVLIITAEDGSSYRSALELGVQACLTKPFSINDLLKAIEYHLKHKKQEVKCSIGN